MNLPEPASSNRTSESLLSALDSILIGTLALMASNSRYTVRDRGGNWEHDEDDYVDDPSYVMDAEEADHNFEIEDVEQGGNGHEGEGSDEYHEGEEEEGSEDPLERVITLDELREWTGAGRFYSHSSKV